MSATLEDWINNVGPGWRPLVRETDRRLKEIVPDYTISQIKEKFGGLRYYYDVPPGTPEPVWRKAMEIANEAEAKSTTICEMCGEPGTQQTPTRYWIKTLCETCAEKMREEVKNR